MGMGDEGIGLDWVEGSRVVGWMDVMGMMDGRGCGGESMGGAGIGMGLRLMEWGWLGWRGCSGLQLS